MVALLRSFHPLRYWGRDALRLCWYCCSQVVHRVPVVNLPHRSMQGRLGTGGQRTLVRDVVLPPFVVLPVEWDAVGFSGWFDLAGTTLWVSQWMTALSF